MVFRIFLLGLTQIRPGRLTSVNSHVAPLLESRIAVLVDRYPKPAMVVTPHLFRSRREMLRSDTYFAQGYGGNGIAS